MIVVRLGEYSWEGRESVIINLKDGGTASVSNIEDLEADFIFETFEEYTGWLEENRSNPHISNKLK